MFSSIVHLTIKKVKLIIHQDNYLDPVLAGQVCPYCNCPTELVSDKEIYGPNSQYGGKYYRCVKNHDHYVGCHAYSTLALGRVADKTLRELKHQGHELFDPLWKNKVFSSRPKAYYWLSKQMGIRRDLTHFGMFDEEQCRMAISIITNFINTLK